uniref:BPTI/Kunitz inhibitor domain-containing protein n=1 Tax=Trichobilharzia regenti TaxID=157069 RepID=A0AA85KM78_TRIRE|nr:unnamed protein product [Trichobilharzia regenti]
MLSQQFCILFILISLFKIHLCADCEDGCLLKPDTGRCRAAIPSYYYDPSSNTCKVFTYGGCGGNGNRFPSKEACEKACNCGKPNNKQ